MQHWTCDIFHAEYVPQSPCWLRQLQFPSNSAFLNHNQDSPLAWKQADNSLMLIQMMSAGMGVAALPN